MKQQEVIPCIFYFYIHYKLKEKHRVGTVLTIKEAMKFLFEWRIPKELRPIIIKELEILQLLEKINKKTVKINDSGFNLEDIREYYELLGIWKKNSSLENENEVI